ncbi:sn-glycerol-3-phosphate dehydrogenase subunit A [Actinobacillus equuli]|nr:sn-glycerol-3-phosphate dehydrogenase subunit A [Actinobacillus equuli]
MSRGIVLLDHAERDGLDGFITITGGKLMTYRLMAEWATDLVCKKLNKSDRLCSTAERPLPGSNESREETSKKLFHCRIRFVILRFIVMVPEHCVYLKPSV